MEIFKNEFCNEVIRAGFSPDEAVRIIRALSVTLRGYTVTKKDANIDVYNMDYAITKIINVYVTCKQIEGCSQGYLKMINTILPKLFVYARKSPEKMSSFDIRGFLANWQDTHSISGRTMETYRIIINGFFAWLQQEGYIMKNPCASIKKIKQEIKPRESLTQMDMEIIRANLVNSRERMLIEVLFSTGCRVSEFAGIKLTDIKWAGKETVVQVLGKGKKYRDCPLTARAQIAIKKYFAECGFTSEWLYPSTYDGHKKLTYATVEKDVAKINARVEGMISHKLHPHIIRHTTATIALQNGMPVEYVKELLGHSRLDTTMIYAETDMSQLQQYHNRCVG